MAIGRPSKYTDELADLICRRMAEGESLLQICKGANMPHRITVIAWKNKDEAFRNKYMRAREEQADTIAERAVDEAMTAKDPQLARLAYDALRWYAGKLKPGAYGDKMQHTGADGTGPVLQRIERVIVDPKD